RNTIRLIDANLNRVRESLRVLEDVARFIIEDYKKAEEIRLIRHNLHNFLPPAHILITARDIERDEGRRFESPKKKGWQDVLTKNFAKCEEGLRVLEDFANPNISSLRYQLYGIEKQLLKKVSISGLYLIIDTGLCEPVSVARELKDSGSRLIQLRAKDIGLREFVKIAKEIKSLSDDLLLVINDRCDVALAVDAWGLHLGEKDMDISDAKRIFSGVIGITCHTLKEAEKAEEGGADYISAGPIFRTSTKPELHPKGLDFISKVKKRVSLPVVAIGGINLENIALVKERGADAIAVCSAIISQKDIKSAISSYLAILHKNI
ncbi:MAG: thiamine phosphate synthase, partial [Candidatus Desantisbacteria bacterium]